MFRPQFREPDFANLAAVLEKKVPSRPTLFEFYLNNRVYKALTGDKFKPKGYFPEIETIVRAYDSAGYDYATVTASDFTFVDYVEHKGQTESQNSNIKIFDRESFDKFEWRNPDNYNMDEFAAIKDYLPAKMKIIPWGPGGVLENVVRLVGYENLCMMVYDDEQLVYDMFEKVGSTLIKYYKRTLDYSFVGAIMSNDDWGFNTQTMMSPKDMRRFVFPWHKKIVELAHGSGRYAMLHSCGNYTSIIDDVINDMQYDARHSYEDKIIPVEKAYEQLKGKLGVLGGIDLNYMVTESCENIYKRAKNLIDISLKDGGYALGTGNSVPEYIPDQNYFAMIKAAWC